MRRIALLGYPQCHVSGIAATADCLTLLNTLLSRAGSERALFEWQVLSPDGMALDTPSGIRLDADGDWSDADGADVIFIPAMHYERTDQFLRQVGALSNDVAMLRDFHRRGSRIAANCTGTFLLAESGLLDDRRGTTSWWLNAPFTARYPRVRYLPDAATTEQDGLYCSGPEQARASMLMQLIEPYVGRDLMLLAAKLLLVDTNRLSQAPYVTLQAYLGHQDPLIGKAQQLMQARLAEPQSLTELAAQLGTSVRTLIRRFHRSTGQTPATYLRTMRIDAAKRLLETTGLNLDRIAQRVGYSDTSAFRKLFQKSTSLTPREYRQRFGVADAPASEDATSS